MTTVNIVQQLNNFIHTRAVIAGFSTKAETSSLRDICHAPHRDLT